jgi:hypothetical protein
MSLQRHSASCDDAGSDWWLVKTTSESGQALQPLSPYCDVWGSQGGEDTDVVLLGCQPMQTCMVYITVSEEHTVSIFRAEKTLLWYSVNCYTSSSLCLLTKKLIRKRTIFQSCKFLHHLYVMNLVLQITADFWRHSGYKVCTSVVRWFWPYVTVADVQSSISS